MNSGVAVSRRVLVIAAMGQETRGVRRRLRGVRGFRWAGGRAWRGAFDGAEKTEVWVVHCGIGQTSAEDASRRMVRMGVQFDGGFVVGLAGGLDPVLAPGDLVEARAVLDGSGIFGEMAFNDPSGSIRSEVGFEKIPGKVVTSPTLLQTAREKASLWEKMGTPAGAVVDMETYGLCCGLEGVVRGFRCARVVSDAAGEDLPPFLAGIGENNRGVSVVKVLLGLLREPRVLSDLLRLRRRLRIGAEALGEWVEQQVGLDDG